MQQTDLKNEHVQAAEWEKATCLQELDITATDLSKECLMDVLTRIPSIRWLSIGQQDGMTDSVMKVFSLKHFLFTKMDLGHIGLQGAILGIIDSTK